jgi:hypothetical protein
MKKHFSKREDSMCQPKGQKDILRESMNIALEITPWSPKLQSPIYLILRKKAETEYNTHFRGIFSCGKWQGDIFQIHLLVNGPLMT